MQSTSNHLWLLSDILGQGATANVFRGRHKVRTVLSLFSSLCFPLTSTFIWKPLALWCWLLGGGRGCLKKRDFYDFCDYLRFSLFGGSASVYVYTEWKKLEVDWKVFLPSYLTSQWWERWWVGRCHRITHGWFSSAQPRAHAVSKIACYTVDWSEKRFSTWKPELVGCVLVWDILTLGEVGVGLKGFQWQVKNPNSCIGG